MAFSQLLSKSYNQPIPQPKIITNKLLRTKHFYSSVFKPLRVADIVKFFKYLLFQLSSFNIVPLFHIVQISSISGHYHNFFHIWHGHTLVFKIHLYSFFLRLIYILDDQQGTQCLRNHQKPYSEYYMYVH